MVLEFILNPHTKNIIVGRKGSPIICSGKNCGEEIIVTGYVMCPRCKTTKVNYPEDLGVPVDVENEGKALVCPACRVVIPIKDDKGNYNVIWTQKVISKHRHNKHDYYHENCWNSKFISSEDE
jgi:uncharacterized protein YbaR (Trm112 family)